MELTLLTVRDCPHAAEFEQRLGLVLAWTARAGSGWPTRSQPPRPRTRSRSPMAPRVYAMCAIDTLGIVLDQATAEALGAETFGPLLSDDA